MIALVFIIVISKMSGLGQKVSKCTTETEVTGCVSWGGAMNSVIEAGLS